MGSYTQNPSWHIMSAAKETKNQFHLDIDYFLFLLSIPLGRLITVSNNSTWEIVYSFSIDDNHPSREIRAMSQKAQWYKPVAGL